MALQPRFPDVLHLVMWNGFAADCAPAMATCRDTWTDDRVWYPFGINIRYGPQQKTRLQIISDHCIPLDNGKKPNDVVYKTHEYFLKRVEEFRAHAEATHHQKAFQKALDAGDVEGKTLLIHAAIKNNIPLTEFLIENGVDVNLLTNRGGSAHHFASEHSDKTLSGKLVDAGAKYEDGYGVEEPLRVIHRMERNDVWNFSVLDYINDFYRIAHIGIDDINVKKKKRAHDEKLANPPPRVKASLFKKQFGRK